MNANEKREFIAALCNRIRDELIAKVPKMPEEWDGHELRALLEDAAIGANMGQCASRAGRTIYPYRKGDKARRKAFENECAVRNL